MPHPPEVRFLVDASPLPLRLALITGLLSLLQVGWYSTLNWKLSWQMGFVGCSLLLAWVWVWLSLQTPSKGVLHWDGQQWQWSGFPASNCFLQRHLDFQMLMLVSLSRPGDRTVWLWLQRSHDPLHWLALRRAVVHNTSAGQARQATTP